MSALNIRSWSDVRAFAYVLLPVVATLLVTLGVLNEEQAALWSGLVVALLGPVVQVLYTRSLSSFRTAFYAVLGAAQALVVGYGIATDEQIGVWLPLVTAVVGAAGGGVAEANLRQQQV